MLFVWDSSRPLAFPNLFATATVAAVAPAPQADARVIGMALNHARAQQPVVVCLEGLLIVRLSGTLFGPKPLLMYCDVPPFTAVRDYVVLGHWVSWIGWAYDERKLMIMPGYSDIQQSA